jgi:mitochondrial splicing suppressor protein 51
MVLALRSILHPPTGAPEGSEQSVGKPQVRIFIVGARAESSLPPHVWEQLGFLFPSSNFHLIFVGPEVSLPQAEQDAALGKTPKQPAPPATREGSNAAATASETRVPSEESTSLSATTKAPYTPNVYLPAVPATIDRVQFTRSSVARYGVPSYTSPYSYAMSITGLQTSYEKVHPLFEETLDPYSDCFFFFSPGFGFPSQDSMDPETGEPLLQIASPTEWGNIIPMLLATKCPIFVTGFSPADVERDIRSLSTAPGVAGEFEWVITPGPNAFGSEKWEVADFDPRVMVKTNWGIWGIRGKSREIQEKSFFDNLFTRKSSP